jgi:kynurenine formamidase
MKPTLMLMLVFGCERPVVERTEQALDVPTADDARAAMANPTCSYGPARWGAADQAGQSNTQTPDKLLEAAGFIRPGSRTISLGHTFHEGMPEFPFPTLVGYHLDIPDGTHRVALGNLVAQEELVVSEMGQVGSEMDALGHMCFLHNGATDLGDADCYGGRHERDIYDPKGLRELGVEHIKPYFTRGILLDVERYLNNNQRLAPGTAITLEMLTATMAAEQLTISDLREGDVVLIRTGQEELWDRPDLGYYYGATPGLNLESDQFLASRCVGNVGADNWPVEVQPSVDHPFAVHEFNITVAGIPQLENLALRELSDYLLTVEGSNRYIFAFQVTPLGMTGATGSPTVPIAIR